jgi:putative peptidoglycan lipid II flippase
MIKGFRQIASLTALSRVFGLVRDIAFAYFIGAGTLFDGWVIAFRIPNLARRLFGEGAASASFIPVYTQELSRDKVSAGKLARTVVTVISAVLLGIIIVGQLLIWGYYAFFTEFDSTRIMLQLSSIMLPYMLFICVVAIIAGILNSHRHFAMPAAAPLVLNIFIIATLCITGWVFGLSGKGQLYIVAIAILIAGLAQFLMQLIPLNKCGVSIRPAWQTQSVAFKKIIVMMIPMIIGLTVTQINTLADDVIAKCLSGSLEKGSQFQFFGKAISYPVWEGAVSQLYYSQRLYQFPLGVFGISLATAIFPVMSAEAGRKDYKALAKTISRGIKGAFFVALPAMAGMFLVAKPLVVVLFERGQFDENDSTMVTLALCFYSLGLCGFFFQQIVTRAFYSMQDSKTPMFSAVGAVLVNLILNLTLIWPLGIKGLALSTAICSYLQVMILMVILRKRLGRSVGQGVLTNGCKTAVGTVIMGLCGGGVLFLMRGLDAGWKFELVRLGVIVPVCIVVYAITAKILKNEMLSMVIGSKKG